MNYILMHRKTPVAEIEIDTETVAISKIGNVFASDHIPIGIDSENGEPNRRSLDDWWRGRSIPASRQNLTEAMENLGILSSEELLTRCFGLSLSDQYWVNPMKNLLKWDDINFFDNSFSEDVGNALFGKMEQGEDIDLTSPDNTSDGVLKKKWKIIDGKRCLIKGGDLPFYQQPLNEVCATIIMERLNIPHVPYSVHVEDDVPYSICECFINSKTDLVSAFSIKNTQNMNKNLSKYQHFIDCCKVLGIPKAQEDIEKMLVLDYLILNEDRHYRNFGAIRDAETLEWIGIAPVFDSGTSLWHNQSRISPSHDILRKIKAKPFEGSHEEQIKLVKDFSWLDLSALNGIDADFFDILSKSQYIDDQRIYEICKGFSARVQSLSQYVHSLQPKTIAINQGDHEL